MVGARGVGWPRAWLAVSAAVAATLTAAMLGACGVDAQPGGAGVRVVAGFYPLEFVAEQVGGARVSVHSLAQPGAEPHDLELRPSQVAELHEADLVVYLRGFQPAVDEATSQAGAPALDVATTVALLGADGEAAGQPGAPGAGSPDPHFWLDPTRLAGIGDALAARLSDLDPAGAMAYRDGAESLRARLVALDQEYQQALRTCAAREIVTSHAAFGYLADRYRLTQVAISGLTPQAEPQPRRLAEVAAQARRLGATTIFFETQVSAKVADAIAAEVGADTAVLDPIESMPAGAAADYFSVMRANLAALVVALRCR